MSEVVDSSSTIVGCKPTSLLHTYVCVKRMICNPYILFYHIYLINLMNALICFPAF